MTFIVNTMGTPELVARKLFKGGMAVETTEPIMRNIVKDLRRVNMLQIKSKGRRGKTPYKQLTTETFFKKGNDQLLFTQGSLPGYSQYSNNTLVNSVTKADAQFQVVKIMKTGFDFGTKRPNARSHQFGNPKRNIPPRPFMVVTAGDVNRWQKMIAKHLMDAIEKDTK